jgi:hypothetical protein
MSNTGFAEQFLRDVAQHELHVIRDDGTYRHLRFKRPNTYCMHFDLITWPGYLCYTGDMGTFVFTRVPDMLRFFRRDAGSPAFRIDFRYWAEKVQAGDRCDGVDEFSPDKFKAEVRDFFEQSTSDSEDWPEERKAALWSEITDDVFGDLDDCGEHWAWVRLWEFQHDGFSFQDWERSCREWSQRFLWCCHALEWAIDVYDAAKAPKAEVAPC